MMLSQSYLQAAEDKDIFISKTALDIPLLLSRAHDPKAGAVVLFSGEVREGIPGKEVAFLEYEAHVTLASKMIGAILEEAKLKWPLIFASAVHRIGKIEVGESAVVVITASPHRKDAYAANQFIIDKLKSEVPIWKCEHFKDGTKVWAGSPTVHQTHDAVP
jgi:molybdopterin synthase catalytic subunit